LRPPPLFNMTVLGFTRNCPECGVHQYFAESKDWKCGSCDAVYGEETVEVNAPHVFIKDDSWIDKVPEGMTGDTRRETFKEVQECRKNPTATEDGRLAMKIPPAVYHARMRQDKDYWRDPANTKRHTNWRVQH